MREYQVPVFSSGTHPQMSTSGSGGFLFYATLVDNDGVDIVKPTHRSKKLKAKAEKVNVEASEKSGDAHME